LELVFGVVFMVAGGAFGSVERWHAVAEGRAVTAGTVMLTALPVFIGIELPMSFLAYDILSTPRNPIHRALVRILPDRGSGSGKGALQLRKAW
jgi:hypothetical protein